MEIAFERRASPLICIGLVILSVTLFAWRVYVQVLQRERRLLAKNRKPTVKQAQQTAKTSSIETKAKPKKQTSQRTEPKTNCPQVKSPLEQLDELVSEDTEPITEPVPAEEPTHQDLNRSSLTRAPGSILHRSASNCETNPTSVHNDTLPEPEPQSRETSHEVSTPQNTDMSNGASKGPEEASNENPDPTSKGSDSVNSAASPAVEETGDTSHRNVGEAVESEAPIVGAPETDSDKETSDEEGGTVQRSDAEAERLKLLGNEKYSSRDFDEALECYSHAIDACPRRSKTLASILFCNMAAVHFSEGRWEECIQCCSDSIELDPNFVKAYIRRYRANMAFKKYTEAASDLSKALEIEPNLRSTFENELVAIERLAKEQFEKDKAEMLGKLKDFGNWALGKVGMSLDNFNVIQDPQTGSYNIQYQPPEGAPSKTDAPSS
eukprot:Protomagalhaensia_sp_Gyna_25__2322@NODE_227_length_4270_cov_139_711652_g177_i0_p2_GENE_NODE_227_length_4270_cov_139_711652_g177_i0NODE_227_length_4270_cov_139_711652_g177_i0_p2_ORF_typecomplete_len437_score82_53TPR_11/PF13414_6/0_00029TPR_11/PF13414_6/0_00023TPR_11/PF13414_6/0_086TPR_2/PF07719_17/0_00048TPR_2/PF07719_17/0_00044TPR_2/PF07719_17/0_13TPR_1/PF00515_28/0_012TPR_1/PF00515_28/1_8e05TPR_1/PF00515_28/0_13TPR_9/PF13371_6/2_8TPR_9/PF13371_6/1_7e07TPR_19/PF14559_6/0_00027TPR_19/PF14559_6/1_